LILDTTYTNEELPSHDGWGHSSWQQGVELANAAGAEQLCLFHHDPDHDDDMMDRIAAKAKAARPATIVAREGLKVDIGLRAATAAAAAPAEAASAAGHAP
jgi:ribonuclease BN (tRNA processing enzyme)